MIHWSCATACGHGISNTRRRATPRLGSVRMRDQGPEPAVRDHLVMVCGLQYVARAVAVVATAALGLVAVRDAR